MNNIFIDFWTAHFPILSILLPAFTAFFLIILGNPGSACLQTDWRQPLRRTISVFSALFGLILAVLMLQYADTGKIKVYELSEWSAPFGIVLVVDRLSAMMVSLTYLLATPIIWYACASWDYRGRYFHAMCHFLLMGVCGAFLTGDLFNLFVFFEILLMASYVLLLHSHSKSRFKLGVHYVIINLLASAMFLIGLGMIYANVGSLNMADVARIFPTLAAEQHQMAMTGAMFLFVVFGIKAAMLPVGFWLPKTYAVAATPVVALFTIMTKVGIYAILRVNGVVFADEEGKAFVSDWLLIIGLVTSVYGVIGAIGAERFRRAIGFMVLSSIGTILIALALFNIQAWSGALFYLVHSTLIASIFYLFAEWVCAQRGKTFKDYLTLSPMMKQGTLLSIIFLIIALMLTGLPPFSGFIGKVLILQGTASHPYQIAIILTIVLVSILSILALVRIGFIFFWRATPPETDPKEPEYQAYQELDGHPPKRNDIVIYFFILVLMIYAVLAGSVHRYTQATAVQLTNYQLYEEKILKKDASGNVISVQPFEPNYLPYTKESGSQDDQYKAVIPYIISPATLEGEHMKSEKLDISKSSDEATARSEEN